MRVVFMGTPDFAVPTLENIIKAGHEVIAVVTQPDKPKGRSKTMQFTPVKEVAVAHNIPVYQPIRIKKDEEFIEQLREMAPDVIVVIAFGQMLPQSVLDIPKYGCINVHGSLLPKYRGAAPIQWSIIDGEEETGVTTMMMDVGCDTGDMLLKATTKITREDTGGSLFDRLATMGADLLIETLKAAEEGTLVREKQGEAQSEYAKMFTKSSGEIDFNKDAAYIERLVRALNPWPSAYTHLDGKTLKIWSADVVEDKVEGQVGEIVEVKKDELLVQTGKGILALKELQLEGKKRMTVDAFLRGYEVKQGTILGKLEA
ncbi:MAG: methionyl-tRNA formyltransferase [bacterium]|nr:methionyl-tRNA formyltransferase [bacterium]